MKRFTKIISIILIISIFSMSGIASFTVNAETDIPSLSLSDIDEIMNKNIDKYLPIDDEQTQDSTDENTQNDIYIPEKILIPTASKCINLGEQSCYLNRTKEQIATKYNAVIGNIDISQSLYSEIGSMVSPYKENTISADAQKTLLGFSNYQRWLAGLSDYSTGDLTTITSVARGALLLSVASAIGHNPSQPEDMDDDFYNDAITVTKGNISYASGTTINSAINKIRNLTNDTNNATNSEINMGSYHQGYDTPGHRNSFLQRGGSEITYGASDRVLLQYYKYAQFDPNKSGTFTETDNNETAYVWPAPGAFPVDEIDKNAVWSIYINTDKVDFGAQTPVITITDLVTDQEYIRNEEITEANRDVKGYSWSNFWGKSIAFAPPEVESYVGKSFNVRIDNLEDSDGNEISLEYTIDFFTYDELTNIVTFDSVNGTSVASQKIIGDGFAKVPQNPERKGYIFNGWYKDAEYIDSWDFENDEVTENITLYAKWNVIFYPIIYILDDGTNAETNPELYTVEDDITFANPTRENYKFVGWYSDAEFTNDAITKIEVGTTDEVILYAKWDEILEEKVTVMFLNNEDEKIDVQEINKGETAVEPDLELTTDVIFLGWFTDAQATTKFDFEQPIYENTIVYARWKSIIDMENSILAMRLNSAKAIFNSTDQVFVDDTSEDEIPFTLNKNTMVPVRLLEKFGATVDYTGPTDPIIIKYNGIKLEVIIGSDKMEKTFEDEVTIVTLDGVDGPVEAIFIEGKTYLPYRALCEALGLSVEYVNNNDEYAIIVSKYLLSSSELEVQVELTKLLDSVVNGIKEVKINENKATIIMSQGNSNVVKIEPNVYDEYVNFTWSDESKGEGVKKLLFSSSDENIVTVTSQGRIVAQNDGVATITISSHNGKTCSIEVIVK